MLPIHPIKCFLKVKKDAVERFQFKVGQLLGQFCLDDGGPCPAVVTTAMEAVMKVNCLQLMVYYPLDALLDRF